MSFYNFRVCIWSQNDYDQFFQSLLRPLCDHHEHISRKEAIGLCHNHLYTSHDANGNPVHHFEARWVMHKAIHKMSAIVLNDPREWAIRDSAGMNTHQLIQLRRK